MSIFKDKLTYSYQNRSDACFELQLLFLYNKQLLYTSVRLDFELAKCLVRCWHSLYFYIMYMYFMYLWTLWLEMVCDTNSIHFV